MCRWEKTFCSPGASGWRQQMVCRFGARIPEGDQGDVGERVARGPVADGQRGAESPWALLTPPWAFSDGYTMTIDSKLRMKCFKQRCSINMADGLSSADVLSTEAGEHRNSSNLPVPFRFPLQREFQGMNMRIKRKLSCTVMSNSVIPMYSPPGPLSMEFSRQEYWSGLPFPSPGDLPDPRIEPGSMSCRDLLHCRQILFQLSY